MLRIGGIVPVTEAEGPGRRFALWVQGCSIRCPGCCNPHLFDASLGRATAVDELVESLRAVRDQIEGVTLLGGEPFEQAQPLARFASAARRLGLSVMTFSGFSLEELRGFASDRAGVVELLVATDVLVDGRFDAALPERERRWAGSTNQRFHYFTDRYSPAIELPAAGEPCATVEVTLAPDGSLRANGWPALVGLRSRH